MIVNGELKYIRRQAIAWKYPELEHGEDKDYRVYNMNRNPESEGYGQEIFIWNTDKYPKPTDEQMLEWYNQYSYKNERVYPTWQTQLDLLYQDMNAGKLDKTGDWYKAVNKVKTDNPKPE